MQLSDPDWLPGATPVDGGVHFTVWAGNASGVDVELYDIEGETPLTRKRLDAAQDGWHHGFIVAATANMRYGLRAHGAYAPERGLWYDPSKLLLDPYAIEIDRPWVHDPRLAERGVDTAALVPKALISRLPAPPYTRPPLFARDGLIYEVNVASLTQLHPDVPPHRRGTFAALGHPAIIAHLKKIGVSAVELMPVVAWIDERHLPPLGLANHWGYNPVGLMALDPRLAPEGFIELRQAVERLHAAGIGVILDLVLNHTGESDAAGPALSLRGLDGEAYFRMRDGHLVNDTGCGNTLRCEYPAARRLILDTLRHFVRNAGVDGFRFDLAPVLGREGHGFDPEAQLLTEIITDPLLEDRILIAEPWDIGVDGYQLGKFPQPFREWNDRYRDDVRRFWRGDTRMIGPLVTRICGSDDVFQGEETRGISFIAAHDGFTLADVVAYERRHNEANGEENLDGHPENFSWNHGAEGPTDDPYINGQRHTDIKALLSTLFATRGNIMLTAGDEFGHSQHGNNNGYAQNFPLDWAMRDMQLEQHIAELAVIRARHPSLTDPGFLHPEEVRWLRPNGEPFTVADWEDPHTAEIAMVLSDIAVLINRSRQPVQFVEPSRLVPARSVLFVAKDIA